MKDRVKLFAGIAACIAITVFGYIFAGYGFDINDEPYQTLNAINPLINPQAILSSWISHAYGQAFGFSLYSMRVLTFSLNLLAIACSVLYFGRRTGCTNLSLFLFFTLTAASLCMPIKSRLIGWDCYAVLFSTLSLIAVLCIWNRGGLKYAMALGLTTGCAILSRFPDIVIVPFALLAVLAEPNRSLRHKISMAGIYLLSLLTSLLAILCIIYHGDPAAWIESLRSGFVSGHNVGRLMANYIHTGALELVDIVLLAVFVFVVSKSKNKHRYYRASLYAALAICVSVALALKIDRAYYPVTRLLTSLIIVILGIAVYKTGKGRKLETVVQAIVVAGCCVTPMAGSDGGTFKFMNLSSIPLALVLLYSLGRKGSMRVCTFTTCVILGAITLITPFYTGHHTVFDGGWIDATHQADHPLLKNNTTTSERAAEINAMIREGRGVVPSDALIIGNNNKRFFSEFLWESRNTLWPHVWDDDILNDRDKAEMLTDAIRKGSVRDIVFAKYGDNEAPYHNNAMRNAIESTGLYTAKDYRWFVVFTRHDGTPRPNPAQPLNIK